MTVVYPQKWEKITPGTSRMKVPGGWLVRLDAFNTRRSYGSLITYLDPVLAICFFPDPNYSWVFNEPNPIKLTECEDSKDVLA